MDSPEAPHPPEGGGPGHAAPPPTTTRRAWLRERLRERNQYPERAPDIDRELLASLQRRLAILTLDMCGFSRLTQKHGALFYLSMIAQMEEAATPPVFNNRGRVIKQEADNFFAVFESPADALEAAMDILLAFRAVNSVVPDDRDIAASIGIGFGDVLDLGDDVYGDEMNHACRLGEDLASRNEILLTPAAAAALPPDAYELDEVTFEDEGRGGAILAFRWRGRRGESR
jgi:class 3 adenylate cyclase